MKTYVICGYGIPKNIETDHNYFIYLNTVFNQIFEGAQNEAASIIVCGGPTNCEPPFDGTEAEIISEYLKGLLDREEVKEQTKGWKIILEDQSLSSLENLINAEKIIKDNGLTRPTIFCEATRGERMRRLAGAIMGSDQIELRTIDFDVSKNRYHSSRLIKKRERAAVENDLWVLGDPTRLEKHHQIFLEKLELIRGLQAQGWSHFDAVAEWKNKASEIVRKYLPDSPALKKGEE